MGVSTASMRESWVVKNITSRELIRLNKRSVIPRRNGCVADVAMSGRTVVWGSRISSGLNWMAIR